MSISPSPRNKISRRTVLSAVPAALMSARALAAGPATAPATKPAVDSVEQKIRNLAGYYAKVYGEPLASPERLPRMIAVVSLSKIDAPETTARLLEVFRLRDRDPVVMYLAWEALHARHKSLSAEQRRAWVTGGLQAALMTGGFPGTTVTPLLRAMAEHHMVAFEDQPWKLAARAVRENALSDPDEKEALNAVRHLVSAWHDPGLVRSILALAGKPALAPRVDHVLRKLPNPPAEAEGPKVLAGWTAWLASANLKAATPDALQRYKGEASVFPAPATITDPNDKRWYAELELGKLTVTDFDLAWSIDSTGSMNEPNQMVATETGLVARVIALVSRRARVGTVYARHEVEPAHLKPCCQEAGSRAGWYQVKPYPLTTDVKALAAAMAAEKIPKPDRQNEGNVHPGTPVLGAMQGAVKGLKWSADKHARKVIVLVGDSPLTPGTEQAAEQFAAQAKKDGFQIHALGTRRAPAEWKGVLKAAGGTMHEFGAGRRAVKRAGGEAAGGGHRSVFTDLATQIVRDSVSAPYRDRVDTLVGVLVGYAGAQAAVDASADGPAR
ncbi:MAG TPA: hypothetical protein VF796_07275 [Humisphaera sp.]